MSWIEQADNSVDYNLQILDGEYDLSSSMQLLSDAQNWRENMNNYLLNDSDFKKYFEWDSFHQENLWNCWIIAALDSITHLSNYEHLIKTSVKKTSDWFDIRLPMWAPSNYPGAKWYHTKLQDLSNVQLWIDWQPLLLLNQFDGDKWAWFWCLVHALWQMITGTSEFNYTKLTYWPTGSLVPFECFIYWFAGETHLKPYMKYVTDVVNYIRWWYYGEDNIKECLENFNPETQSMTVIVSTTDDHPPRIRDDVEAWTWIWCYMPDHVVSVADVRRTSSGEFLIWLSEPHTADKTVYYPYHKFIKMIWWYTIARFDQKKYESGWAVAGFQKYWINHHAIWAWDDHGNYTIQSQVENSRKFIRKDLSDARWDVIVWDLWTRSGNGTKNDIIIEWWNENVKIIDNGDSVKMEITKGTITYTLDINNSSFDSSGNKNYFYDSACRVALFIERMVHDYIKPRSWAEASPFYLTDDWAINFKEETDTYLEDIYRSFNPLTVLYSSAFKEKLWIKYGDVARWNIVNFLNRLYDWPSRPRWESRVSRVGQRQR